MSSRNQNGQSEVHACHGAGLVIPSWKPEMMPGTHDDLVFKFHGVLNFI
jgi:hypothetical protein